MKLSAFQLYEGQQIPWWGRPWRRDPVRCYTYVLPIPICWLARLAWNLWCLSFRLRPNTWERARQDAWRAGHEAGINAGLVSSEVYARAWANAITDLQELAAKFSKADRAEEGE